MSPRGEIDLKGLRSVFGSGLTWFAVALVLFIVVLLFSIRVGRVAGTEVGILLNKMDGSMELISQSGVRIYNGITHEFHTLDKTLQTLPMTGQDALKVKTIDGSDVYVDLKVQYKIDADKAVEVINTSGPDDAFKEKWIRDYIRSISRDHLGELTTEQFYDSSKRNAAITNAKNEAQQRLQGYGITIDSIVIPVKPRFYAQYEALIKRKKLADQAVLEEESKARAAKQRQQTEKVEKTNEKNVAVETFQGQMQQKVIKAQAEGERVRKEADAYYDRVTIGAEAEFYRQQKEANAILAQKKAEAAGIEALKKALEGEGGRNMVKLEYARKLRGLKLTGKPFTLEAQTQRFEHTSPAAAAPATR